MRALILVALAALPLAACSSKPRVFAPDAAVQAARYSAPPPAEVRVLTTINTKSGGGVHTALIVSGSQRVLFDAAGTFSHPRAPERHDVLYGLDEGILAAFLDYHSRDEFDVIEQSLVVPVSVADDLIRRAESAGPVADGACTSVISSLVAKTPGFEAIGGTMFPKALSKDLRAVPGIRERLVTEVPRGSHNVVFVKPGTETPIN